MQKINVLKKIKIELLLYRVYHLKCNPTTAMYWSTKIKSEAGPLSCNTLSQTAL
jgi:hypothetical protein